MTDQRLEVADAVDRHGEPSGLEAVVAHEPIHRHDRIPAFMLNAQSWAFGFFSYRNRLHIGVAVVAIALAVAFLLSGTRLLNIIVGFLDVFALAGLFLVNWIGNGGILVPIPGARFIGLLMIFQHAVVMPSWEVFIVSGAAMALGLLSYYIAGARTTRAYRRGDGARAAELAADTGMLAQAGESVTDLGAVNTGVGDGPAAATVATDRAGSSTSQRLRRRFSDSWERTTERAQPAVEKHGVWGMFWLCFPPTPLGTAAAFLGGAMGFGFTRYLLASFASKYLLAGVIIAGALFIVPA